jgi:hypothetical protein
MYYKKTKGKYIWEFCLNVIIKKTNECQTFTINSLTLHSTLYSLLLLGMVTLTKQQHCSCFIVSCGICIKKDEITFNLMHFVLYKQLQYFDELVKSLSIHLFCKNENEGHSKKSPTRWFRRPVPAGNRKNRSPDTDIVFLLPFSDRNRSVRFDLSDIVVNYNFFL